MSLPVVDGESTLTSVKTTLDGSDHVPHHRVDASALPTGAATDAKLDEISAKLPAALVSGRLSVDVGVSALPAGAATDATLADGLAPLPPTISGVNAPSGNVTVGSSSTAEAAVGGTGFFTFQCTSEPATGQNGYFVVFGPTAMAAASATNGWHIPAGGKETFKFPTGTTWFYRAIRAGSVDAGLKFYKSGQ